MLAEREMYLASVIYQCLVQRLAFFFLLVGEEGLRNEEYFASCNGTYRVLSLLWFSLVLPFTAGLQLLQVLDECTEDVCESSNGTTKVDNDDGVSGVSPTTATHQHRYHIQEPDNVSVETKEETKNETNEEPKEEIAVSHVHEWSPTDLSSSPKCLPIVIKIPHSAYMEDAQWDLLVKCKDSWGGAKVWKLLARRFSSVVVSTKDTSVVVKIPRDNLSSPTSFVVTGSYRPGAYKRMLVALFGGKAVLGKKWTIKGCLIDDDYSALEAVRGEEERRGNHLLVQPRLLLVSKTEKNITFVIKSLSKGWSTLQKCIQYLEPDQVWDFWSKAPTNLEEFSWIIQHEDKNKRYLECQINVEQGENSTYLPVREYFKEEEVEDDWGPVDNEASP